MSSHGGSKTGAWRAVVIWCRGLRRFAIPGLMAAVLVGLTRKLGFLRPDEGFFTAWGVWSALLAAAYNSVLREQKNYDDSASQAANMREFEALKALLQTVCFR